MVGAGHGYIRFLKDEERRTSQGAGAARVQAARAEQIELETKVRGEKLVDREASDYLFADVFQPLRDELGGVAAAATRDPKVRDAIATKVDEAFGRIRVWFAARAAELEAGRRQVLAEDEAGPG